MLTNISPLDGRYKEDVQELSLFFSEHGLIKYRLRIEIEYLIALSTEPAFFDVKPLSSAKQTQLRNIYKQFDHAGAQAVKRIEGRTNHDVKAVEYFLRNKLKGTRLEHLTPWCHFALTSEDVNNLAYSLMWQDSITFIALPLLKKMYSTLRQRARRYRDSSLLSLTHGQPASPTTFGKEMGVYAVRLKRQIKFLMSHVLQGKFGGATGSWGAHVVAFPKVNWEKFSKRFISRLGLDPNLMTTQIEPHDSLVESYQCLIRINNILTDFCRDVWLYISRGILIQKNIAAEVGSSTMPHKINPIQFENAEGNLGISNAILGHFVDKLPISRLQRDLSDSTTLRNQGVALGHALLAFKNIKKGLNRISFNTAYAQQELNEHWEVLTEALQTILRKTGKTDAYEKIKSFTKGRRLSEKDWLEIVESLKIQDSEKELLMNLSPDSYTGLASRLVELI
ncbi:adenylosuccinate lyase [Candidatus Neomarinimicrobiota bacterium]